MKTRGRAKSRRRRIVIALLLAGATVAAISCVFNVPPRSFREVKMARDGRALNGRVAVVYSERYQIDLGGLERTHPFDIRKYARIYLALLTRTGLRPEEVFVPEEASREDLLLVHTPAYLDRLKQSKNVARYLESDALGWLPAGMLDSGILRPFRHATGGTVLASRLALEHGVGINLAGGYHHAKADSGEGFCIYNDLAIAIRKLKSEGLIRRALVVDLDAHQGNGTAEIFAGDDSVFTFSMHQGDIYPVPKATSDLDVELASGTTDEVYLDTLRRHLGDVLSRSDPDVVFLQAGCDTFKDDPLASLAMTREGIVQRDATVIDACVARGIPVVVTMGGGYSESAWEVQFASVRRTIETYGLDPAVERTGRKPTLGEKFYTN